MAGAKFDKFLIDYILYYCYKGGNDMNYKQIIKTIAKSHNTSTKEVEREIKFALNQSGINIPPEMFIKIVSQKIKKDYLS